MIIIWLLCIFQDGHHVLTLNLVKRINRFGGRPHSVLMKCPLGSVLPSREKIQCDPEYIQVTADCSVHNVSLFSLDISTS